MKRFILIVQFAIAFLVLFTIPQHHVHAWVPGAGRGTDNDAAEKNNQMSASPYTKSQSVYQVGNITDMIWCFKGPDNCSEDPEVIRRQNAKSALGNIASAMGSMYANPPADLALWIRDTGESLGFIPRQAYAQGVGFNGLAPLLPIWKAFRNIAYVLLALAMVVVSFMVMMRKRIDPKTVVTVQNALPRIVIALILITFSYAIVGLMIDLMYLVIAFLHFIVQANLPDAADRVPVPFNWVRVNYVSGGFLDLFVSVFQAMNNWNPINQVAGDLATGQIGEAVKDYATGLITSAFTLGPLFMFILALAYLFAFVRILFMLLGSYVQIILGVLTGPIQILVDVFPGGTGFSNWIKNIAANLIVFPITVVLLMIANAIAASFGAGTLWTPPFLPQPVIQTGVGDVGGMGGLAEALISIGIILMIPNIVNSLKEAFKTKPAISTGVNVGGAWNTALQLLSAGYYIKVLKGSGKETLTGAGGVRPPPGIAQEHGGPG